MKEEQKETESKPPHMPLTFALQLKGNIIDMHFIILIHYYI